MTVKLVLFSDTHGHHRRMAVPDGDILIFAGDMFLFGDGNSLEDFNAFLGELPHRHKLVIAGNHDYCFEKESARSAASLSNAIYLQDQAIALDGIKLYGSPWQPQFGNMAFNLERGAALREKWDMIPADTDVLITHAPPFGRGDRTAQGEHLGCQDLLEAVQRIQPRLHVFGHIHEAVGTSQAGKTTFINASICNAAYEWANAPVVFEYELPDQAGSQAIRRE